MTIARAFVEEIILKFGIPQTILTDQGSNFMSEVFRNVCKLLKINKIKCTAYHPQTNSALERTHRVHVEYLWCFILEGQNNWNKWLPYATFVFNTTPHTSTGFTPHKLLFGRKPNIPKLLQRDPPDAQYTYNNYVKELQSHLQSSYPVARSNLTQQKEHNKEYHDRNVNTPWFTIGDKVLLHDEKVRRGRSAKLSFPWIGPYDIDIDDVNMTLKLPWNRTLKVHINRLKPFDYRTMTSVLRPWTIFVLIILLTVTAALDATLQKFNRSPGLYCDHVGEAQLYNTEWKLLTYVDLQEADQNLETVVRYAQLSKDFCKKHEHSFWINFTDCMRIARYIDRQVKEVEELRVLVRQLTGVEDKDQTRFKRGVFNFVGGISKILFGTMDSNNASYYAEKVSHLEEQQLEFFSLSKEQVTVVKSTLRSLNSTLLAVSENERILSRAAIPNLFESWSPF